MWQDCSEEEFMNAAIVWNVSLVDGTQSVDRCDKVAEQILLCVVSNAAVICISYSDDDFMMLQAE